MDSFLLKTKFVGLVERITIEHDNTGVLPDWNLDKVLCEYIYEVLLSLLIINTIPCSQYDP